MAARSRRRDSYLRNFYLTAHRRAFIRLISCPVDCPASCSSWQWNFIILPEHSSFKIREGNDNHRHIIECPSHQRIFYNILYSQTCLLMHICCFTILNTVPYATRALFIRQLIKYSITYVYPINLLASAMKSCSLVSLNYMISGVQITTFGFPPNLYNFASGSPNVLQTESRPGKTLGGPIMKSFWMNASLLRSELIAEVLGVAVAVLTLSVQLTDKSVRHALRSFFFLFHHSAYDLWSNW